jgi:hypothetical protein
LIQTFVAIANRYVMTSQIAVHGFADGRACITTSLS